ncbi:MAG: 30S ribosomal protein S4 [Parcubacteria group bacterium]|nr:30S ribosomal protein S4 [Parcubacteria group bacterium]
MPRIKQFKIARRLGARVFPKTENPRFVLTPRQRTQKHRVAPLSEYGTQLLEKQKVRYAYGLREAQFSNYVKKAMGKKGANSAAQLFRLLESRADNVVYRLGLANTRRAARQMVSHGHITVNGRKTTVPSQSLSVGDRVGVRAGSSGKKLFQEIEKSFETRTPPAWLARDEKKREGVVSAAPSLETGGEALFNLTSVIEFYSR